MLSTHSALGCSVPHVHTHMTFDLHNHTMIFSHPSFPIFIDEDLRHRELKCNVPSRNWGLKRGVAHSCHQGGGG